MPHFDYAMQGEADRSFVRFLEMLSGKVTEQEVPGLVYRRGQDIFANERNRIEELDELPQVIRSFLDAYYASGMY
jgi:hypothetical protein